MQNYYYPDYVNIDLDPSDDDFDKAILTAQAAKQYFDKNKIKSFVKTSGKTGIHLYLPCEGFTFPEAKKIADHICNEIHLLVPAITTTAFSKSQRGTKLYIDSNQNIEAHTLASAYSVRPFHTPTVSTPLEWKEVKIGLSQYDFDINTILNRIKKKGDLFENILNKKTMIANTKVLGQYL